MNLFCSKNTSKYINKLEFYPPEMWERVILLCYSPEKSSFDPRSPVVICTYSDIKTQQRTLGLFIFTATFFPRHSHVLGSLLYQLYSNSKCFWRPHLQSSRHFQTGLLLWVHCPHGLRFLEGTLSGSEEHLTQRQITKALVVLANRLQTRGVSSQNFFLVCV